MDIEKLRARLAELVAEMRAIHTAPEDLDEAARAEWAPDDEALARFDTLDTEATEVRTKVDEFEKRAAAIAASSARIGGDDAPRNRGSFDPPNINRGDDPYDTSTISFDTSDMRARVETALERDTVTPDDVKTSIARTVRNVHGSVRAAAVRCIATGSEEYRSAFAKMASGQKDMWTDTERQAVARAQSLTDAAGGFAVPYTLDPTIIGTDVGTINPIRRISRVVQTTTDSWNGVTGGAATWSWDAEGAEVSDDAITLAEPSIPVYKGAGFIPFSVEIGGDWAAIDSDLRTALMEGKDNLEGTAHMKGTGSAQPTGIETALAGGASEIAPQTVEVFAAADVYELQRVLPPRHRQAGPVWTFNIGTANDIRQFDTGGGGNFWTSLTPGAPETLLGWRWEEASVMDDSPDINPAVTDTNYIIIVGNWSRFVIVDRVGMSVEFIPNLFHTTTNRPSGQRGLYTWYRTGSDSVDDNAFRMLNVATTL